MEGGELGNDDDTDIATDYHDCESHVEEVEGNGGEVEVWGNGDAPPIVLSLEDRVKLREDMIHTQWSSNEP